MEVETLQGQLAVFRIVMVVNVMPKIVHVQKCHEIDTMIPLVVIQVMNNQQGQFGELIERHDIEGREHKQDMDANRSQNVAVGGGW